MDQSTGELSTLSRAVKSRDVRAIDVVEHALGRIEELDPALNTVVARRDDQAREDAKAIDAAVDAGEDPGPLTGVPVLVKDLEDVAGMRTTMGSLLFADVPPATAHSTVPARLVGAGAVIVGKSNLPEFATEGYTANRLFGTTVNPWAPQYSPGGSSGGSAAAVASGMVPIATATDGGGSIRIPAAFCGLVGLKPTNGVIGRWPAPDWIDYSTEGPFATTTADLSMLLQIEAGPTPGDASGLPRLPTPSGRPVANLWVIDLFCSDRPLPEDVAQVFGSAVQAMAELLELTPQRVTAHELFGVTNPDEDWFTTATAEHVARFGREWVESSLPQMHSGARGFMEWGLRIDIDQYLAARRRRYELVRTMDRLLGEDAIVVSPTIGASGWLADGRLSLDDEPGMLPPESFNTAIQNITGHPALSLPAGVCTNGVPFGLAVTGPRYRDLDLIALAERWELAHPWQRVAPGYVEFNASMGLR